jgi:hypothetical protein
MYLVIKIYYTMSWSRFNKTISVICWFQIQTCSGLRFQNECDWHQNQANYAADAKPNETNILLIFDKTGSFLLLKIRFRTWSNSNHTKKSVNGVDFIL